MRLMKSAIVAVLLAASPAFASGEAREPRLPDGGFSFSNPIFGKYDRAQLQRGFQVYKEICASCHGLKFVAFRDLEGIGFTKEEVKAIAKGYTGTNVNLDTGEVEDRPGLPTDYFPSPYQNEEAAAAANNGAAPPDLSLVVKARAGGAPYIYSLLTGYREAPPKTVKNSVGKHEKFKLSAGQNYNPYFPGFKIAMARQLEDGKIEYQDGTKATEKQMAADVAAFLTWAAEPKLEQRRQTGVSVLLFLAMLSVLSYLSYKRIWADVK
jgi:ubiquinol-cytochrome c reductase cytochrome c1 subunit